MPSSPGHGAAAASSAGVLATKAQHLLAAHHAEEPLLLANVWDVASARAVEDAGFGAIATSSHAVADVLGERDDDSLSPDLVFDWVARIAGAVSVPVTADLEAGYRLDPAELVDRLLAAGAVGCNLQDTDHHGAGILVDPGRQADYLAGVRAAADAAGVHVVVNARIDTFIRGVGEGQTQVDDAVGRARRYLDAGADCVYPFMLTSDINRDQLASMIQSVPGPLNAMARRGGFGIGVLASIGVRRISLASGLFRLVDERLRQVATALAGGSELDDL